MAKFYVLYNPLAGNDRGEDAAKKLTEILKNDELIYVNMTSFGGYSEFFSSITEDDKIIIAGGDGTLNRFVNETSGIEFNNEVYLFACGSGNDFLTDIGGTKDQPVQINQYIVNLPVCEVNGKKYKFINGIGYGIDGYCCEVGDKMRAAGKKKINYTTIAIKGLLFRYKRVNAKITVDGEEHTYKKVWLAPTMNGRYYGGGMMATPSQDRLGDEKTVTISPMFGSNKIKTLMVFPSIFQGKHVEHTEMVSVFHGHKVKVEFDKPTALQVDGETILGVTEYTVYADEETRKASL